MEHTKPWILILIFIPSFCFANPLHTKSEIQNLCIDITEVGFTGEDKCLDEAEHTFAINVNSMTPTAVCNSALNAALGTNGMASLTTSEIDGGSTGTGSLTIEVRRIGGCLGTSSWGSSVNFGCCDTDQLVTVELRVTDATNNSAVCWTQVLVEDALAPTITCPADYTLNCDDPAVQNPFGTPVADDNCNVTTSFTDINNLDQCQAGTLRRTWTASDGSIKSADVSCSQTVTVEHVSDFIVQFPADVTVNTCPDNLPFTGEPNITDDDCELVAVSHEDFFFNIAANACYKIERTWTVVNWCTYDAGNPTNTDLGFPQPLPRTYQDDDGYFTWVQTININDEEAPLITCPSDTIICDNTLNCESAITLTIDAEDNCSTADLLEYSYLIDIFNDNSFDISDNGIVASWTLPYGTHRIRWFVEDYCGNITDPCEYLFTIEDCQNPEPSCINSTSISVSNGTCTTVNASSLLDMTSDNCTSSTYLENSATIRLSGSTNPPQASIDFCDTDAGSQQVEVFVTDEAGNSASCIATVDVVLEDCPMHIVLNNTTISNNGYNAESSIASNGIVGPFGNVEFTAGDSICLNPGFEVIEGSLFHAHIQGCPITIQNEENNEK